MEKKLWLLRPIHKEGDDPWEPWYDKAFGFVVRASTEERARELAHEEAGDENRGEFMFDIIAKTKTPWLDKKYSTCEELTPDGEEEVVIRDYSAA